MLQNKIKSYLSTLIIRENDLKLLYELFIYYNPILLFNLDKQTYLHSIFNQHEQRSYNFYVKWFEYFLCDASYANNEGEWYHSQLLMNEWLDKVVRNPVLFSQIMNEMDSLLEQLNNTVNNNLNNRSFTYFVKCMIDKCFKQGIEFYLF